MNRFWSRVEKTDGCWLWLGSKMNAGYGKINFSGKRWLVHRMAYMLTYGPIPEGKLVLHRCDNRLCVNPAHLYAGTHFDNVHDMMERQRHPWVTYSEDAVFESDNYSLPDK